MPLWRVCGGNTMKIIDIFTPCPLWMRYCVRFVNWWDLLLSTFNCMNHLLCILSTASCKRENNGSYRIPHYCIIYSIHNAFILVHSYWYLLFFFTQYRQVSKNGNWNERLISIALYLHVTTILLVFDLVERAQQLNLIQAHFLNLCSVFRCYFNKITRIHANFGFQLKKYSIILLLPLPPRDEQLTYIVDAKLLFTRRKKKQQ